jgi:peptidoglycan/xylan/chitin deacetylase (PgdA/CDA1 family)
MYSMKRTPGYPLLGGFAAIVIVFSIVISGCDVKPEIKTALSAPSFEVKATPVVHTPEPPAITKPISAESRDVLAKKEVPILCYHQIRDYRETDSKTARAYIVPDASFRDQLKMLADSGYHTILPDQLYAYLTTGAALPAKPVMLTFDDSRAEHFSIAAAEMKKYGFKGVFFIMTVSLDRPNYMTKAQVKELADAGHVIGSHTWDHHNVKKYVDQDWVTQIEKPSKQLETITGKPVKYFAYPFGLWNKQAIPHLKQRNMLAAFQLSEKRDADDPLHTIRRIIVPGSWSNTTLRTWMRNSF